MEVHNQYQEQEYNNFQLLYKIRMILICFFISYQIQIILKLILLELLRHLFMIHHKILITGQIFILIHMTNQMKKNYYMIIITLLITNIINYNVWYYKDI
jgi:hypothetical protein